MTQMSDLQSLYQEVILDHNKRPKNYGRPSSFDLEKEGHNPLCGDHYHLFLSFQKEGGLDSVSFEGEGCAISKASASMMTEAVKGKTKKEVEELFNQFHRLLKRELDPEKDQNELGKLKIFANIWRYPARVKCAGLAWHTLHAALHKEEGIVKTE